MPERFKVTKSREVGAVGGETATGGAGSAVPFDEEAGGRLLPPRRSQADRTGEWEG